MWSDIICSCCFIWYSQCATRIYECTSEEWNFLFFAVSSNEMHGNSNIQIKMELLCSIQDSHPYWCQTGNTLKCNREIYIIILASTTTIATTTTTTTTTMVSTMTSQSTSNLPTNQVNILVNPLPPLLLQLLQLCPQWLVNPYLPCQQIR